MVAAAAAAAASAAVDEPDRLITTAAVIITELYSRHLPRARTFQPSLRRPVTCV